MAGISSKAAGELQNKEKTFQGQRFDDDLGLNWVQFKYRNHDPQIGRFIEIDPLSDQYPYNSTYAFSEDKVTSFVELEGLELGDFMQLIKENVWDNGIVPVSRWANSNINFLTPVVEVATGKSIESNLTQDKPRSDAAVEGMMFLDPEVKVEAVAEKTLTMYEVGTADKLLNRSVKGDGLDVHHVSQSKPASQVIKGYDKTTAPAIALPKIEHAKIPTLKGTNTAGNARQQLAKDIKDLRKYTNAPNNSLQKVIDLNKHTYPTEFKKN